MLRHLASIGIALPFACSRPEPTASEPLEKSVVADVARDEAIPDRLKDLEHRAFPLLVWAAFAVEQEYVDVARMDPRAQLTSAADALGRHLPEFFAVVEGAAMNVAVRSARRRFEIESVHGLADATDRLEEILVFAQEVLQLPSDAEREMEYAAINGLLAPLDPHTVLLTPEQHAELGIRTRGRFGGIGVEISALGGRLVVQRVLPDHAAAAAGLRAGDVIVRIDRQSTNGMTLQRAQELLRGPIDTAVVVGLRRGSTGREVRITRTEVRIPSVSATDLPDGVVYVDLRTFQEDTAEQFTGVLAGARADARGIVLDLRGNSGGLLAQATAVLDRFVDEGELVVVRSAGGREADPATPGTAVSAATPVIVLVDEDTASAAEVVAGGLQALARAVVLGRTTFGKGSVQMLKPVSPYGRELALKLTVAEYLVAGDRRIQSRGVVPDLELIPIEVEPIPGVVRMFDEERFERARERSQLGTEGGTGSAPAPLRVRYLLEPAADRGTPLGDPEIRLAHELAVALGGVGADAAARTARVAEVVARRADAEDLRLREALRHDGVEWDPGGASSSPSPLILQAALSQTRPLVAGKPFRLRLSLENRGTEALERVHVVTDCLHDELDGIELLVGRVAPATSEVRELELQVMPWQTGFVDELRVDAYVGEPGSGPAARATVLFQIGDVPEPRLAFDYWLVDDPALAKAAPPRPPAPPVPGEPPFAVRGDGDGMPSAGERLLLVVAVRNDGPVASPDVRVLAGNLSGEQGLLEEGAITLGSIAPGKTRAGSFGFVVGDAPDSAIPIEFDVTAGDAVRRVSVQHRLRFRVVEGQPPVVAGRRRVHVIDEPLRLYAGGHPSARVVAELAPGAPLSIVGRQGGFSWVDAGVVGRRLYAPADVAVADGPRSSRAAIGLQPAVLPPGVDLQPTPAVTDRSSLRIDGVATHPNRVRDVVISVKSVGRTGFARKVHYQANPAVEGEEARRLAFSAEVPLQAGSNRISVVARDGDKVARRRDVLVFRNVQRGAGSTGAADVPAGP